MSRTFETDRKHKDFAFKLQQAAQVSEKLTVAMTDYSLAGIISVRVDEDKYFNAVRRLFSMQGIKTKEV